MLADNLEWLRRDIEEGFVHDSIEYYVYRLSDAITVTLCEFCALDIGSYRPEYFGLPKGKRLQFTDLRLVKPVPNPRIGKDKYCPQCKSRLAFITFVLSVRDASASST